MKDRDKYIVSIANALLRLASPEYRDALKRVIEDGALSRAQNEGATEKLADELLLFRFGGHFSEGEYFLNQEANLDHYREQAIDNARRILTENRLMPVGSGLDAEDRERLERACDWLTRANFNPRHPHNPANYPNDPILGPEGSAKNHAVEALVEVQAVLRNLASHQPESQRGDEIALRLSRPSAVRLEQHLTSHFGEGRLVQEVRAAFQSPESQQEGRGEPCIACDNGWLQIGDETFLPCPVHQPDVEPGTVARHSHPDWLDFRGPFPLDFLRDEERVRSAIAEGYDCEVLIDAETTIPIKVGDRLIRNQETGELTVERAALHLQGEEGR